MRATEREVGGYRLLRQIGFGGMSTVYEAVNGGGDHVALKLLHPSVAADESSRLRLQREVAVLRRVRSPYVAEVIDAEIDGVEPFIVTELVDGLTLEKDVEINGIYTEEDLLQLGEKLEQALRCVHELGVVHRDLKPSNVMIADSRPVLIDFGIAQDINATRLTQPGALALTPGYCDPRVLRGEEPDRAADWWALAAVLAFAASGEPPFGSGATPVVLQRVIQGDVSFPGLAESSAQAFRAALATDVQMRLSYQDLLEALRDPYAFIAPTLIAPNLPHNRLINDEARTRKLGTDSLPSPELRGGDLRNTALLNDAFLNRHGNEMPESESLTLPAPVSMMSEPPAVVSDTPYAPAGDEHIFSDERPQLPASSWVPVPSWARPPKKVRLTLLIAWFALVFLGSRFPIMVCGVFVFAVFIFDVIGRSAEDMRDRRLRRGKPKRRDGLIAAIRSPIALLLAALRTIGAVAVVGISVYCCLMIAATISHGTIDFSYINLEPFGTATTAQSTGSLPHSNDLLKEGGLPEWAAAASGIFSCGVWFFPRGKYAREGARYTLGGASAASTPRIVWTIIAVTALFWSIYIALGTNVAVSWAPLSHAFYFLS